MDLATVANEPVVINTPRGPLKATPGSVRKLAPVQSWLNRQPRPKGNAPAPAILPMTAAKEFLLKPAPADASPEERKRIALEKDRLAKSGGKVPAAADADWPPDLYTPEAYRLIVESDEAMALVLAAAFARHHPELVQDEEEAGNLLDDLTMAQFQQIYLIALGMATAEAGESEADPKGEAAGTPAAAVA